MLFIPRVHEIYKHFKGDLYQITAIAEHTETGEQLVIYQAMYGEFKIYARPLDMFISKVDKEKYPDVEQEFRFELQGPDAARQKTARQNAEGQITQKSENAAEGINQNLSEPEDAKPEEAELDPMLLDFLDADSYAERLNILTALHHRITGEMITTMAIACDVEINEGAVEERYDSLRNCLLTLERYECNRLR